MRTGRTSTLVTLVQLPLFLFSVRFFPITSYLTGSAPSSGSLPCTIRGTAARLSLGQFDWIMIFRAGYLLFIALIVCTSPARRFKKILTP